MRRQRLRVLGPYLDRHHGRYVYEIRRADGSRHRERCRRGRTFAGALAEVAAVRARLEADDAQIRTVGDAVTAYVSHLVELELATPDWSDHAFARLLARFAETPIGLLTAGNLVRVLDDMTSLALATQRSYWHAVRRLCRWFAARGLTARNLAEDAADELVREGRTLPWRTVGGARRMGHGKAQLTEGEIGRYVAAAMRLEHPRDVCASVLPVLTGMDSTELRHLEVRDVDLAGGAIWARQGLKRRDRRRTFPIPESLRGPLSELVCERPAQAVVFGAPDGSVRTRWWLLHLVVSVAEAAGVTRVTPHGLRGTYATVLFERGRRTLGQVAQVLGHADQGQTADRHYVRGVEHRAELVLPEGAGE